MALTIKELPNGDLYYYKGDELHRDDDLPAVECSNGYKAWYQDGEKHRETGPATTTNQYYLHDDVYDYEDWIKLVAKSERFLLAQWFNHRMRKRKDKSLPNGSQVYDIYTSLPRVIWAEMIRQLSSSRN